jgi:2-polyprenyl-6-methoxyphenol hydroxylase-like FAD-dependent oxidoreductase
LESRLKHRLSLAEACPRETKQMTQVLIVGAGPVGLTLAVELARHGVPCRIIDQSPEPLPFCRAIGVTPRTLEVWESMGIAGPMIDAGMWITGMRSVVDGRPSQDMSFPDFGLPYGHLGVPQYETERVLTEELARRNIVVERTVAFERLQQTDADVTVQLRDSAGTTKSERFAYVVGCDGAHSGVRRTIGAEFEGAAYPWSFMLGDVHIDWDLPYGMSFRALHLVPGGPPRMFIAIPLPERGRYRVSMLASEALSGGSTGHGIQAELPGPSLNDIQAVADGLLADKPRLSDLRWSSIFRISMRLASRYRQGRVFIAGDAAHIHPPTGGQGMNTGIQDAYNLAWKLALVQQGFSPPSLLDSYEAERRPVGAEVLARTHAASQAYGREQAKEADDRFADTQIPISYRTSPIVREDAGAEVPGPQAGDRALDIRGLERDGFGFPLRLFDVLRGTDHTLIVRPEAGNDTGDSALEAFAGALKTRYHGRIRLIVVSNGALAQRPHMTLVRDSRQRFEAEYGPAGAFLVRPDGHIAWRGASWRAAGLGEFLERLSLTAPPS